MNASSLPRGGPLAAPPGRVLVGVYFLVVAALVARIALLDDWSFPRWAVLGLFVATVARDRITPTRRALAVGVALFAMLCAVITYFPGIWFDIAYRLNHSKHYVWNANAFMRAIPLNDGHFLWAHTVEPVEDVFRWIYVNGFDMVVWIPVVRGLVAFDVRKVAAYALGSHVVQFPLIMPFYTAFRVDEVWSVLGHADRIGRGWSDEMRLDLGANCFPSMHTSVAFAILLLALREKSAAYRVMMTVYAVSIIVSTLYLEIHWVVDVLGGLALGYVAVKATDRILARVPTALPGADPALPRAAAPL